MDGKGVPDNVRYKRFREATGKLPLEIAAMVGIPIHLAYDLEAYERQLNRQMSLAELSKLSSVLGVRSKTIFDDRETGQSISHEQLIAKIQDYLAKTRMSLSEFEDRVGFVMEPALRDSAEVLKWNVDCLRFVCKEIRIDWLAALP
jgi:hypothetical protein